MRDAIIGICRFSFLGRCDWVETRKRDGGSPEVLQGRIPMLYAGERLERRFEAFEKICLPSIRAQTDPDFSLWMLTSPELPQRWLDKLLALCADIPQIEVIMSAARSPAEALADPLRSAAAAAGRPVIQFRIDDDDAISRHHVARIRRDAQRLNDLPAFGISYPAGLIINSYDGQKTSYWRAHQAFVGAGAALRMRGPGRCIFALNHPSIPRHFPVFTDISGLGYVQTRWEAGDSAVNKRHAQMPHWFSPLGTHQFQKSLAEDFPFLVGQDLGFINRHSG